MDWRAFLKTVFLPPGGDDRQGLRMQRYLMGAATSLMVVGLLWVAYWFDGLEWRGLIQGRHSFSSGSSSSTSRSAPDSTFGSAIRV